MNVFSAERTLPDAALHTSDGTRAQGVWRRALAQRRTQLGLVMFATVVLIALLGPLVAPHATDEFVGKPLDPHAGAFGTDALGRDVLSRFLAGGRTLLLLAVASTVIVAVLGVGVGLAAAYSRSWVDDALMRSTDIALAFPQIVLALVAVATVGPKLWVMVLVVGLTTAPRTARIMRGAALGVVGRDYVAAAEAIGESRTRIVLGEVLPNVTGPLAAELTMKFMLTISIVASLSFLGFGLQPPAADWGVMINENRVGLATQPWGVLLPVTAIAVLTIGCSLLGDGLARSAAGLDEARAER